MGGVGACTLITKSALSKGVNFKRIKNVTFWGEDIHFCIRAAVLGIPRFVDTHYPAYHIYRESDLAGVEDFKKNPEMKTGAWQPEPEMLSIEEETNLLVSIIIPTLNRPRLLMEAVNSVIRQTYGNLEIIVVNDGGTDVSTQLDSFDDNRIVLIQHEVSRGPTIARNAGINVAKGKYVAYLNDDDLYYPHHIQTLVTELENSWFKVAYSDREYAFKALEKDQLITFSQKPSYSLPFDHDKIIIENRIPIICLMHEKSCFDIIGLFDESLDYSAGEWNQWIRLSKAFPFKHIPKITAQESTIAGYSHSSPWSGQLLSEIQLMHARYKDDFDEKSQSKLALNFRDELYRKVLGELESMDDEQLWQLQPVDMLQKIADSSLLNTQTDMRNARALSGYLSQRFPNATAFWRIHAKLCRTLKDFRSAAIAITRALQLEESAENLQEYHLVVEQVGANK